VVLAESLLRDGAAPIVIAHRGASGRTPENTMPAFRAAFADGAVWVETDVQPTADNVLVLLHDDDVDRTTDGSGAIRSLTVAHAAALDAGRWFGDDFAGTPIPLLGELLSEITGERRLLLEIKGEHTSAQLALLLDQLDTSGSAARVFLQSFEIPVLHRLKALRPDDPFGLLVETIDDDPVRTCHTLGATAYNPDVTEVRRRPAVVAELHAAGIATTPWTADSPDEWAALTALGVDGIITNRPAELVTWQAAHHQA
jgi:glycerophosphoryl diester phosphodiesterase